MTPNVFDGSLIILSVSSLRFSDSTQLWREYIHTCRCSWWWWWWWGGRTVTIFGYFRHLYVCGQWKNGRGTMIIVLRGCWCWSDQQRSNVILGRLFSSRQRKQINMANDHVPANSFQNLVDLWVREWLYKWVTIYRVCIRIAPSRYTHPIHWSIHDVRQCANTERGEYF